MLRILTIIGARPQFIKASAISRAIRTNYSNQIHEIIIHTGQHYDKKMSNVFFEELELPREKYNLNIGSGSHAEQTAKMMIEIEKIVFKENPNVILLYGDTNSTLAACLVGIKIQIPIIHVEAGVRSYNKKFPEEVNRLICDHMSSLLFVPSDAGIDSLKKEGITIQSEPKYPINADNPMVFRCGDIMYDNTLFFLDKVEQKEKDLYEKYSFDKNDFILATMHRPSNVDKTNTLKSILTGFNAIIKEHNKSIILPLHPRTKKNLNQTPELKKLISNNKLHIISPISFLEMLILEKSADLIITDSGGVQKEAYFLKKPCLIMLEETPWPELIESKNALLVGSDSKKIIEGAYHFFVEKKDLNFAPLYGDGRASEYICEEMIKILK